jgi:hypothetical protein
MFVCSNWDLFLGTINIIGDQKDAQYICNAMAEYIQNVGVENVVQICMDNASNMHSASNILKVRCTQPYTFKVVRHIVLTSFWRIRWKNHGWNVLWPMPRQLSLSFKHTTCLLQFTVDMNQPSACHTLQKHDLPQNFSSLTYWLMYRGYWEDNHRPKLASICQLSTDLASKGFHIKGDWGLLKCVK